MKPRLDEMLDTGQAARVMGIDKRALERLRAAGRGPMHTYVGRFVRYRRAHVVKYLADRAVMPRDV